MSHDLPRWGGHSEAGSDDRVVEPSPFVYPVFSFLVLPLMKCDRAKEEELTSRGCPPRIRSDCMRGCGTAPWFDSHTTPWGRESEWGREIGQQHEKKMFRADSSALEVAMFFQRSESSKELIVWWARSIHDLGTQEKGKPALFGQHKPAECLQRNR